MPTRIADVENANNLASYWESLMDVYVARQPIFNENKQLAAYELLFRDSMANIFPDIDGNTATSKLLSRSFFNIGMPQLTGGKTAFINFTRDLLVGQVPTMFPADAIMVEVLEDVTPDAELIEACRAIAAKGYSFALDDFVYADELDSLIDLAQVIKIDFRATASNDILQMIDRLSDRAVTFLAEKIETYEEFESAVAMGFRLFQGYFFSKPEILSARDITPSKMSMLRLMAEVNEPDIDIHKLENIFNLDVSLSYKLLRYINSAYFRRVQEISAIRQAMGMLGEQGLRQFVMLVGAAELTAGKPDELIRAAIIRAKFCERIGRRNRLRVPPEELFLVGLFSYIDAMLDAPMAEIMDRLPLSALAKQALIHHKGTAAGVLNAVAAYETGRWSVCQRLMDAMGLSSDPMPEDYMEAIGWADAYPLD